MEEVVYDINEVIRGKEQILERTSSIHGGFQPKRKDSVSGRFKTKVSEAPIKVTVEVWEV